MRKPIVCNIISLDGFYSGVGGNVMAMLFDNGFSNSTGQHNWRQLDTPRGADRRVFSMRKANSPKRQWQLQGPIKCKAEQKSGALAQ